MGKKTKSPSRLREGLGEGRLLSVQSPQQMHVRDWVRTLSLPGFGPGLHEWYSVAPEAMAPLAARLRVADPHLRFVVVAPSHERALHWQARLALFGISAAMLPSGQASLFDDAPPERNALSDRSAALLLLLSGKPTAICTTPAALLERTLPPNEFHSATVAVNVGDSIEVDALLRRLVAIGYEREEPVRRPGTFSKRGGIVDVFPAGAEFPVRMEWFGDTVDSMRTFDAETQRSILDASHVECAPFRAAIPNADDAMLQRLMRLANEQGDDTLQEAIASDVAALQQNAYFDRLELYAPYLHSQDACALDYLNDALLLLDEPVELEASYQRSYEDLAHALEHRHAREELLKQDAGDYLLPISRCGKIANGVALSALGAPCGWFSGVRSDLEIASLAPYRGRAEALAQAIVNWKDAGIRITIATDQPTRARSMFANLDVSITDGTAENAGEIGLVSGNLAGGFVWTRESCALLTDAELFGVGRLRLPQRRFREGAPIATVLDLKPGDYVVHIQFGIGQYRGLVTREVEGQSKEFLLVHYAPPDKLLVPTDQLDRIQKYLSPSDAEPTLHRITGGEWQRAMRSAKKGAEELARELIEIYAKRATVTRPPFGADSPWQSELEATFPWVETPSQLKTIQEVKRDLDKQTPMDRLVCGDVGFGKTEVAVRAAFKVAQEGKQVAVLCPTTILADQHYETFRERLAPYPLQVHLLNRFRTAKQKAATLKGLKDGSVEIVIGTHALLNKNIEYKNLGLVIVDEEQRFGVKHKEALKKLRASVDFLTLTATPIPRTLSMALMNLRQMSVIHDPPPGRLPIRTYLRPYGDEVVREALLRELARGGQVFYVYNRVDGIQHVAEKVRQLAPNARVAVGHGQMTADELEPIMNAFFHGEVDVLVSTTIVENGIDNPNANTLIVEGADRLGLAQLYQLRGRVGRSDRQAYAYLLYRSGKKLTEGALARLKALQEFSDLGSGYSLAFRDLQIRGAGELLGGKQHGMMAAVGYELYTQLINDAVQQLKVAFDEGGETGARLTPVDLDVGPEFHPLPAFDLPAAAYLPKSYVADDAQRLFYYKKLMEARSEESIAELEAELIDRYGPLPDEVLSAAKLVRLRMAAQERGITKIDGRFGRMAIQFAKGREMPVRVVHAMQREHRSLKFRADRAEWPYGSDALKSVEEFLSFLENALSETSVSARRTSP